MGFSPSQEGCKIEVSKVARMNADSGARGRCNPVQEQHTLKHLELLFHFYQEIQAPRPWGTRKYITGNALDRGQNSCCHKHKDDKAFGD